MDLSPVEFALVLVVILLLVMMLAQSQQLSTLKARVSRLDRTVHPKVPPGTSGLPSDVEQEMLRLVDAGQKIAAIKLVRERTGLGLKEAKELVERF